MWRKVTHPVKKLSPQGKTGPVSANLQRRRCEEEEEGAAFTSVNSSTGSHASHESKQRTGSFCSSRFLGKDASLVHQSRQIYRTRFCRQRLVQSGSVLAIDTRVKLKREEGSCCDTCSPTAWTSGSTFSFTNSTGCSGQESEWEGKKTTCASQLLCLRAICVYVWVNWKNEWDGWEKIRSPGSELRTNPTSHLVGV